MMRSHLEVQKQEQSVQGGVDEKETMKGEMHGEEHEDGEELPTYHAALEGI